MTLTDLQKTFDTVNYDISIKKMEFIGFSEETNVLNLTYEIGNSKFILRILSQSLGSSYANFLKNPF